MTDAAALSWQLRDLLRRWQNLARSGWDNDRPAPDPWRALSADTFAFRAALAADDGAVFRAAEALESVVNLRLALEQDPAFRSGRPRWLRRMRQTPQLRESRKLHDQLALLRMEAILAAALKEVS